MVEIYRQNFQISALEKNVSQLSLFVPKYKKISIGSDNGFEPNSKLSIS